jgi:hypothetical protein
MANNENFFSYIRFGLFESGTWSKSLVWLSVWDTAAGENINM